MRLSHAKRGPADANLTSSSKAQFRLVGRSRAMANTNIGLITLDAIKVDVPTSLDGLQGLKGLTTIQGVDVQSGTQDAINLAINGDFRSFLHVQSDVCFQSPLTIPPILISPRVI